MKTRALMVYRTKIERLTHVADAGGGSTDYWGPVAETPCYAWVPTRPSMSQEVVTLTRAEIINTRFVAVPRSVDVKNGDRLLDITDRKGAVKLAGPFMVDGVAEKRDHFLLFTRKVS